MSASAMPDSPCIRQCTLDAADVCIGCGRTLAEILDWSMLDAAARQRVIERAQARRADRERKWTHRP